MKRTMHCPHSNPLCDDCKKILDDMFTSPSTPREALSKLIESIAWQCICKYKVEFDGHPRVIGVCVCKIEKRKKEAIAQGLALIETQKHLSLTNFAKKLEGRAEVAETSYDFATDEFHKYKVIPVSALHELLKEVQGL